MSLDVISYNKAILALRKAGFVGTKDVDETNLADGNIIHYSEELDKYISKELKIKVKEWRPNTEYEKNEIVVYDNIMHWVLEDNTSHESSIDFDLIEDKIIPLASEAGLANILGLEYTVTPNKDSAALTWTNPSAESFDSRVAFVGENIDIMGKTYDECVELLTTSNGDVQKITEGLGTGLGEEDTVTFPMELRKTYYVKVFALHSTGEGVVASSGRYTMIENRDTIPPVASEDLAGEIVDEGTARLTWTQPTDEDFFYAKVVRSQEATPETPTQGTVLDTVSGEGTYTDTGLLKGITYYYSIFFFDDAGNGMEYGKEGNWSISNSIELVDVPVYGFSVIAEQRTQDAVGLTQEDFDLHYPWSDMARAVVDNAGVVQYYLDDEDSSLQEDGFTPANLTGRDGNVVVEIPEFFYAYIDNEVLIGHEMFDGATKFDRTLIGAFEASETSTGELQSAAGANVLVSKSVVEYRQMVGHIGAGWQQRDMELHNVLKMLFMIEYGGLDSQSLIGEGVVNAVSDIRTGSTVSLGNRSGVSSEGAVSYRGIENPWGNTWEFLEGFVATDEAYYTAASGFDSFVGDVSTGSYTSTGIVPITQDGFMSSFVNNDLLVADGVIGDSVTFTGDYQSSHRQGETNVAVVGGNYGDGDKAGLFRIHMGLRPYGDEKEMELVAAEPTYSTYELEIDETELEKIRGIVVE